MLEFLRICGIAIPCYLAFSVVLGIIVGRVLKVSSAACSEPIDSLATRPSASYVPDYADAAGLQPAL